MTRLSIPGLLKSSSSSPELASKGKNAIEVSSGDELISTLEKLRVATMSGELDESINQASLLVRARFKK